MQNNWKVFLSISGIVIIVAALLVLSSPKDDNNDQDKTADALKSEQVNGDVAGASTQANTEKIDEYDDAYIEKLAQHLNNEGMVLYGAYWCSHCKTQKELFGDAFKLVDYVECDAKGPEGNPDECQAQGIKAYPTWIYKGEKYTGTKPLAELAKITNFSD